MIFSVDPLNRLISVPAQSSTVPLPPADARDDLKKPVGTAVPKGDVSRSSHQLSTARFNTLEELFDAKTLPAFSVTAEK